MRSGMSYFELAQYCLELEVKLEKAMDNTGRKAAVATVPALYRGAVDAKAGQEQVQHQQSPDMSWLDSFARPQGVDVA